MRVNKYIIRGKKYQETARLNRAWNKWQTEYDLVFEIYGYKVSIYNECINCKETTAEKNIFEITLQLTRTSWLCPLCHKENALLCENVGILFNMARMVKDFMAIIYATISQSDIDKKTDGYKLFRLYSILQGISMKEQNETLRLNLSINENPDDDWRNIVSKDKYNILPATRIAKIVNKSVKEIRKLRKEAKQRPKY